VISSNTTGKCNAVNTLGITPEDKERGYIGCFGRCETDSVSGILDSEQISKYPLKEEKSKLPNG